jgi:hypothetical protein
MAHTRLAGVATLVIAMVFTVAGPAQAAPPDNDTHGGATVVDVLNLPFTDQVDTTEATSDADDDAIAAQCAGVPAWDASVWYQITAAESGALAADFSASSYSAGGFVVTGSPGSFILVTCGPGAVAWPTVAGETYSLVVFDDQGDGGGNGGVLNLTIDIAPPPPEIDVTVNTKGTFNPRTGEATISGTVTCSGDAQFAFLDVELSQTVGRLIVRGFSGTNVTCDGATRPWSLLIRGENGTFGGGKALSVTVAVACGPFLCGEDFNETMVRLTRDSTARAV